MRFYKRQKRQPAIVIVSLIDILAILLIFFIVTTTFRTEQPEVVINLPQSSTATSGSAPTSPAVVYVTKANEVFFETRPVTVDQLGAVLRDLRSDAPGRGVAMQADKEADFGVIVNVLDAFKSAGFDNLPAFTAPSS